MSGSGSTKGQPSGRQPGEGSRPGASPRAVRNVTLLALVLVEFLTVALLLGKCVSFVVNPDPAVKAGPMYVTLALTTISALLMLALAVNASLFPFVTQAQARDVRLVMVATGATGILTGVLTVGVAVQSVVTILFVGAIAYAFIWVQEARIERAYRSGRSSQPGQPGETTKPRARSRQRRGGRKR